MSKISYTIIKNEKLLADKIMGLENLAKEELMKLKSLYIEDLFFMSAIDKTLKLIDSFLFALSQKNITVLACLTRIQLDCVLRTYATTLVKDSSKFCEDVLLNEKQINKFFGIDGEKLTDSYLCKSLGKVLDLDIKGLYAKISGYVHLSSSNFKHISRIKDENVVEFFVSKQNFIEDKDNYQRLSMELANHFYFFGRILIEVFLRSWLIQKEKDKLN